MDFKDSIKEAARRAEIAVNRAMKKYSSGGVTDEDDLTGVLIGNLDAEIDGKIGGLDWSTTILRHRKGEASEEGQLGADMLIHVKLKTEQQNYSKGVLIQAKRYEPHENLNKHEHEYLTEQCDKMLKVTSASYVFNYTKASMRCGSALKIAGSTNRDLNHECDWTSYRFFLELFRCPIGDKNLSSNVKELLKKPDGTRSKLLNFVPNIVTISGKQG